MSCLRPNTPRSNPKDIGELAEPLRSRLRTMMDDAPGHGLVLVSGFRDPGRQWDLRHERCPGRECDRGCRGFPLTALPGRSNHQRRTAADIGGRNLAWANRVKARYGLATPVRGEPWHFEAAGRPSVTIRPLTGRIPDSTHKSACKGDRGAHVKSIQVLLNKCQHLHRGPRLVEDGAFGSATDTAVRAFQRFADGMSRLAGGHGMAVDGIVGQATKNALAFWTKEPPPARKGDRGPRVKSIQVLLNKCQHLHKAPKLVEDGAFGTATDTAVRAFQRFADGMSRLAGGPGMAVDGIVGQATMNALAFWTKTPK
jgi:peptidoglycan hydrolase-like protein with peptidoglycan-binding domain